MAVRFSEIWLLIGVVFVVQLPVTRGQLCPPDWTFHALTGSCMTLIRRNFTYGEARYYCQGNFRSSTTKREGHLVFIFDKATDDFVKGLLDDESVDRALIGLNDRGMNGVYTWGDNNEIPTNYTGCVDNPHIPDFGKQVVVTSKDGWEEYDRRSQTYFVCQVSVDFPTPKMVCPVAEVGQQGPDITCTADTRQYFSITGVRFMKKAAVVGSCDASRCWPGLGYEHVADVSEPPETGRSASWTLRLRNVRISDASDWTCSAEFSNSGYWVASQPCSLNVYTKPTDVQCSHQFVHETITITCTAAKVYPQVNCSWIVNRGSEKVTVYDQTVFNVVVNAAGQYRAICTAAFYFNNAGTYNVTVAMVPRLPNFRIEAVKVTSVSVDPVIPVIENGGSALGEVEAIVVGIVAALLVIIIICVIIFLLKRKGSRHVTEEAPVTQAPDDRQYEKIIDFVSDMPDKPVGYANQILLNARDTDVEYENAVSSL